MVATATAAATPLDRVSVAPGAELDLTVRGLRKTFGLAEVLRGVDLDLRRGETVALLGANGSGKSTLLRCAVRALEPDAGEVHLLGERLTGRPRRVVRRQRAQVGFVFQRHFLVPRLSALTNVLHGVQARRAGPRTWLQALATAEDRDAAMGCLEQVGLAEHAAQRVDTLSGGQSQRVAIARALMQRPRLMLADEPAASLDPQAAEDVMTLFVDLVRRQGLSLLYTSHDLAHALSYSDRVVVLRDGEVVHAGRSAEADPARLRRYYEH
ncbi:MAG: phosphonate ABC transporter ATP-binding protein [Alphaproteobacteria bacterium]